MMSSALLNIEGLLNISGLLGVAGSLNFVESQEIAGLLRVAGVGGICSSARISPCFHDSVDRVCPAKLVSWSNTFLLL